MILDMPTRLDFERVNSIMSEVAPSRSKTHLLMRAFFREKQGEMIITDATTKKMQRCYKVCNHTYNF